MFYGYALFVTFLRQTMQNSDETKRLYATEKWEIAQISEHLGITRQAVYDRLRKAGVKLEKRKIVRCLFTKEQLSQLYIVEGRTARQIAQILRTHEQRVLREMQHFGITRRKGARYRRTNPLIKHLKIGDTLRIPSFRRSPSTFWAIYKEARRLGFRVVIRHVDDSWAEVTRTPLLIADEIIRRFNDGASVAQIIETFGTCKKTIWKVAPELRRRKS